MVDWRRIQSEPELADNKGDTFQKKDSVESWTAESMSVPRCTPRKPSERFMRRPLQAKSRASQSERFRLATLKEKLNELVGENTNEQTVFNGYRPGQEAQPG
jgi:hypothetical protein